MFLREYMEMYYRPIRRFCTVICFDKYFVEVEFSKADGTITRRKIYTSQIGENLFFEMSDEHLSISELAKEKKYLFYNNKRIIDEYNKNSKSIKLDFDEEVAKCEILKKLKMDKDFGGFCYYCSFSDLLSENTDGYFTLVSENSIIDQKTVENIPVLMMFSENIIFRPEIRFEKAVSGDVNYGTSNVINTKSKYEWRAFLKDNCNEQDLFRMLNIAINDESAQNLRVSKERMKYLKKVIFRSETESDLARVLFANYNIFEEDEKRFKEYEALYLKKAFFEVEENEINVDFYYNNLKGTFGDYDHCLMVKYDNGEQEMIKISMDNIYDNLIDDGLRILVRLDGRGAICEIVYYINECVSAYWRENDGDLLFIE